MKRTKQTGTRVIFYLDDDGGVFAYFPDMGTDENFFLCYARIGQHSACSPEYIKGRQKAKLWQYGDLLKELIGQGYNDLRVIDNTETVCSRPPTKQEIKFGYGATHYREFTKTQIGYNKRGELKKWFISPDDGLRYYR